ncbi:uncharacterized protein LOC130998850 isoform X2 [Salvia miltiorrhiza]|uniref:uncharacterized protein LOC130998850 isoform X2 n=1 Tax=Salvia miltiorrhiza TaxID=226208 RepID=UPI0025ACFD38|nr:uncharacterized protein LOC130998850 isoform X2 [Salvia miltiorrhiza]
MTPASSKLYADDVSLLMVLIDTNPFFWNSAQSMLPFSKFLTHVLAFLNSILLLNQMNQVVVIAAGYNSCGYIFDSSDPQSQNQRAEDLLDKLEEFVDNDQELCREQSVDGPGFSLLSGSLSMALCYIQRVFRTVLLHPQPRILCLHGSQDGPGQYICSNHEFDFLCSAINGSYRCMRDRSSTLCFPTAGFLYNWWCISEAADIGRIVSVSFGVSATKTQLIWATFALFVYLYSASIRRNVLPVDQCLVRPKHRTPRQHRTGRGRHQWMVRSSAALRLMSIGLGPLVRQLCNSCRRLPNPTTNSRLKKDMECEALDRERLLQSDM